MSLQISRVYLERRYWLSTLAMIFILALTISVSVFHISTLQNNARYSAAFVELAETMNDVERTFLHLQTAAAGTSSADDTTGLAVSLTEVLSDEIDSLLTAYTALRLSDPDADDDDGNEEEAEENRLIAAHAIDIEAVSQRYGLASRGMPKELVALWENEPDENADEAEPLDESKADEEDLLEENVGTFLLLAFAVEEEARETGKLNRAGIARASAHFEATIKPALGDLTVAIRKSADRSAETAYVTSALGAILCIFATISVAFAIFRPMVSAVVTSQAELLSERDNAVASSQAKRDFLAVMSHELRTPMNGILGFTNLALRTDLTSTQQDYLMTIKSSGEDLLELLNAILDLSKIEAGSLEAEPHQFKLYETIDSAVQLMSAQAFEKRLDITHYVDVDLPTELCGDSGLIRKLVLNLLGNAIKFTQEGGVAIEVRRSERAITENDGVWVEIAVCDTGIGIPEEKQQLVFERFSQADASTRRLYEGTGLGLTICKEIAEIMDGRLSLESKVGVGSTFRALLRLDHVEPNAPSHRAYSGHDLSGDRILIVDDNDLNRRIATLQLSAYGARTLPAKSATEALDLLARAEAESDQFDLCLIDQTMPVTDGISLLKMIRSEARYDSIKSILSSSAGIRSDKDAIALGFDAAVPKPVDQERLIQSISDLLVKHEEKSRETILDEELVQAETIPAAVQPQRNHILVVEDNVANLKLARLILEQSGYTLDTAVNGVEAVVAATRFNYEAILMDIRMPIMDGLEATKHIRQLPGKRSTVPIIAMTADIAEYVEGSLEEMGITALVPKPIDEKKLLAVLSNIGLKDSNAA